MPAQRPSFKAEERFDAQTAKLRGSLAEQLQNAIFQATGVDPNDPASAATIDFGLGRKGRLSAKERSHLGKTLARNQRGDKQALLDRARGMGISGRALTGETAASNRSYQDEKSALGTALEVDKAKRQRADLSQIFGKVLQSGAINLSGMGQGALKEPELKQSRFDRFTGGASEALGMFGF